MNASLNEKLKSVKWGEFKLGDLFYVLPYKKKFNANDVVIYENGQYPYIVRTSLNNGMHGYLNEGEEFLNEGNTLSFIIWTRYCNCVLSRKTILYRRQN